MMAKPRCGQRRGLPPSGSAKRLLPRHIDRLANARVAGEAGVWDDLFGLAITTGDTTIFGESQYSAA